MSEAAGLAAVGPEWLLGNARAAEAVAVALVDGDTPAVHAILSTHEHPRALAGTLSVALVRQAFQGGADQDGAKQRIRSLFREMRDAVLDLQPVAGAQPPHHGRSASTDPGEGVMGGDGRRGI